MPTTTRDQTTRLLIGARSGNSAAAELLTPIVYNQLHSIAEVLFRAQPDGITLQPTGLVHEAYLKLVNPSNAAWHDEAHFIAVAATAMRQVLINHAHARAAGKRGGGRPRVCIGDADPASTGADLDLIDLDEALRELEAIDPRKARVVEMRYFGGSTAVQVAAALDISLSTVEADWRFARAWLSRRLGTGGDA
jgi:RNA polymerase sigma factor (TIGR02999 family)